MKCPHCGMEMVEGKLSEQFCFVVEARGRIQCLHK